MGKHPWSRSAEIFDDVKEYLKNPFVITDELYTPENLFKISEASLVVIIEPRSYFTSAFCRRHNKNVVVIRDDFFRKSNNPNETRCEFGIVRFMVWINNQEDKIKSNTVLIYDDYYKSIGDEPTSISLVEMATDQCSDVLYSIKHTAE